MSRPLVTCHIGEGIAHIRLDRPERLNVLDLEMAEDFEIAVNGALADPDVRVIVITGNGKSFCAGGDLASFHAAADKGAAIVDLLAPLNRAILKLAEAPKPVIGGVQGAVAGGGMSLALGFDLLLAAEDTRFNLAYVNIGGVPDCGGSWFLPRLVGLRRALEIALLAESIDAPEAKALGLVNRVVPHGQLEDAVLRLARRLADGPVLALAHTKALLRSSFERGLTGQLEHEAEAFAQCAADPAFDAALSAFFARKSATGTPEP